MEGGGFEPPKASPTDLQSAPFSHSGTPPSNGAGDGTRTRNLLITNQLLYRLSYASKRLLYKVLCFSVLFFCVKNVLEFFQYQRRFSVEEIFSFRHSLRAFDRVQVIMLGVLYCVAVILTQSQN